MEVKDISDFNSIIAVTGANGFVGSKVVQNLINRGFTNLRCSARENSENINLMALQKKYIEKISIIYGDLIDKRTCAELVKDASVLIHCAAGTSKSFAETVSNSVVTTRNLCEACCESSGLRRFVNISSIAVYSNHKIAKNKVIDEDSPIDKECVKRHEAYSYGKFKQEEIVWTFASEMNLPLVNLRLGTVFGPGKKALTSRVGIDSLGIYMHLGGRNRIPLIYIDNCADAIALCSIDENARSGNYNIIDDNLPRSRNLLKLYKKHVGHFKSVPVPYRFFYLFSGLWEDYCKTSREQLPRSFNRRKCETYWKGSLYSNSKIKNDTGWSPSVNMKEALSRYLTYCAAAEKANA